MYSRVPPFKGSTSRWRGVSFKLKTPQMASPYSPMNHTTKGLVHLPLSESFEAESGAFTTTTRVTTHNWIGGSRMATSDHKRSQPPQWRPGSNDPSVTSLQIFNFHESSWRAQPDAQSNGKSTSAQILHSQIPTKQQMLMGE